jgi:phosphoribosylanthranilate isomerase
MARTRIKICGISTSEALEAAVDGGADAIGLVFAGGSPRYVTAAQAKALVRELPAFVEPVGLFVNESAERVRTLAQQIGLAAVQLHGQETPQYAQSLAPLRVIKAVAFDAAAAASTIERWRGVDVAAVLWDAPPPALAGVPGEQGGTGRQFDWNALASLWEPRSQLPPMVLAGGLRPDNVAQAIAALHPFAVDVSSGVEAARGIKDPALIRAFCDAVRKADAG